MIIEGTDISCGVHQLSDIQFMRPKSFLNEIVSFYTLLECHKLERDGWGSLQDYDERLPAFFTFSDIYNPNVANGGQAIANYLKKAKLGPVFESTVRRNENSGNRIRVWIWGPNIQALRAWGRQQKEIEEKKKNERKSRARRNRRSVV